MKVKEWIDKIFGSDISSGLLMIFAMFAAIITANSPYRDVAVHLFETKVFVGVAKFRFSRSFEWWINDVMMVFFFLILYFI